MKKLLLFLAAAFPFLLMAQSNVGIGIANPDASALLELSSTQQGLLVPRLSSIQRQNIAAPANGLMVYDTDSACVYLYNSGATVWRSLCSSGVTGVNYDCGIGTITINGSSQSFTTASKAWLLSGNVVGTTGYFGSEDTTDIRIVTNNSSGRAACSFNNLAQKMIITKSGNVGISFDGVNPPTLPRNKLLVENGTILTGPDIYGRINISPQGIGILSVSNSTDSSNASFLGVVQKDNSYTNIGAATFVSGNSTALNFGYTSFVTGDNSNTFALYTQVTGNNSINTGITTVVGKGSTGSTNTGFNASVMGATTGLNQGLNAVVTGSTGENKGLRARAGDHNTASTQNGGLEGSAVGGLGTIQNYGTAGWAKGLAQQNFGITGYADSGLTYNAGVQGIVDGDHNGGSVCVGVVGELFTGADGSQNFGIEGDMGRIFNPIPGIPYYAVYGIEAGFGGSGISDTLVSNNPAVVNYAGYFNGDVFCNDTYYASDPELKENITDYTGALKQLALLPVKQYTFNRHQYANMHLPLGERVGVLSTDLKAVFPNLVKAAISPGSNGSPSVNFEAVNYNALIPVLIQAVKELDERTAEQKLADKVKEQDAKITELSAQIQDLKNTIKDICNPTQANLIHQ